MRRRVATGLVALIALAGAGRVQALAASELRGAPVTASQIVARNAAARGGVEAWHRIESMAWTGYAENSNSPGRKVPFLLEQKRPGKTRFEVADSTGMKAIRAYDGTGGWKLRPGKAGPPEITPYSAEEMSFARGAQVIDGPLMDYVAKGAAVSISGTDTVDGRKAWVLDARLPSGGLHRVWVDAESFLELRQDREFRNAAGAMAVTTVRYRDYHAFEGLQLPVTIETGGGNGQPVNRLKIERIALNPPIEDKAFVQPEAMSARHGGVVVDTRNAAKSNAPGSARQP